MAASVSSECAFLWGGITITKQWNCFNGHIVEALQCVKCAIWHDLLFQEPGPSSILEAKVTNDDSGTSGDSSNNEEEVSKVEGWNNLLLEEVSDNDDLLTTGMDTNSDAFSFY